MSLMNEPEVVYLPFACVVFPHNLEAGLGNWWESHVKTNTSIQVRGRYKSFNNAGGLFGEPAACDCIWLAGLFTLKDIDELSQLREWITFDVVGNKTVPAIFQDLYSIDVEALEVRLALQNTFSVESNPITTDELFDKLDEMIIEYEEALTYPSELLTLADISDLD